MEHRLLQSIENNDYVSYKNIWNENIDNIRGILNESGSGPIGNNTIELSNKIYKLFIQLSLFETDTSKLKYAYKILDLKILPDIITILTKTEELDDINTILCNINTLVLTTPTNRFNDDFMLLLAWNIFQACLNLIFGKHSKYSIYFLHNLLEMIESSGMLLLLERYVNRLKQNQAEPDDYYSKQLLNRLLTDWNKLKSIREPDIYNNIISLIVTTHIELSENEASLEVYDDFIIPAMLKINIPIIVSITKNELDEDFLAQSIEQWMIHFLDYQINSKHIKVFKYFIDNFGYVPDVNLLENFLELMIDEDSLIKILELLLKHSSDGFIMRNEEEFMNEIIYNNEGTKNFSINVINILIKDYIQRKIKRENSVQIDKFIKLALKEKSIRLLETVIEFIFEYNLKSDESLVMDVFRFIIEKQNVKLLQKVYYLFIVEIGINLNEEQRIELFKLAGQQDNTNVLKYLHDKFIDAASRRNKRYLDTALVSAARSAAPKRRRHLPTIKYLLEQPDMSIIPHQAYQASSESPYPYLSDMFYQHNELLYRPDSGSEYKIALDRFNARLKR